MIKKVSGGYRVYSERGKSLSSVYPTRQQAQKRLNQIHYFQNKK